MKPPESANSDGPERKVRMNNIASINNTPNHFTTKQNRRQAGRGAGNFEIDEIKLRRAFINAGINAAEACRRMKVSAPYFTHACKRGYMTKIGASLLEATCGINPEEYAKGVEEKAKPEDHDVIYSVVRRACEDALRAVMGE